MRDLGKRGIDVVGLLPRVVPHPRRRRQPARLQKGQREHLGRVPVREIAEDRDARMSRPESPRDLDGAGDIGARRQPEREALLPKQRVGAAQSVGVLDL